MTVLDVIKRSTDFLQRKGVDSPRLQVELLLAHVLKVPRLKLYLDFERKLADDELETVRNLITRRGEREPLQYLVGTTSFCGIEVAVTPAVLIPRPETEVLVEHAWKFLGDRPRPAQVLDFATGSGCIAIALAVKFPDAVVHAIDISDVALQIARANAERNKAAIRFHRAAEIAAVAEEDRFDLIVSNPPYIPSGEIETLQPEVRDHEPRMALDGGNDGLEFHRLIARQSANRLRDGGKIMLELGFGQAEAAGQVFANAGWHVEAVLPDNSGCARILIARR
jgi:release factor glutamine methyltransferase